VRQAPDQGSRLGGDELVAPALGWAVVVDEDVHAPRHLDLEGRRERDEGG
jgi:hypothetical protein